MKNEEIIKRCDKILKKVDKRDKEIDNFLLTVTNPGNSQRSILANVAMI
jgi:hypothetical protein